MGKQNSGSGKQFQAHLGHGPGSSLGYFATAVEAAVAYARRVKEIRAEVAAKEAAATEAALAKTKASKNKKKSGGGGSSGVSSAGGVASSRGSTSGASNGGGDDKATAIGGSRRAAGAGKRSYRDGEVSDGADGARKAVKIHSKADKAVDMPTKVEVDEVMAKEEEAGEDENDNDFACSKCLRRGDAVQMLLCDGEGCNIAQHTYCCDPPLLVAPAGDWFCFTCSLQRQATHNLTGRQQMRCLLQLKKCD